MDTRQIEYMIKIADEKSITRAAEKLYITQSALSQQLQKLETELGVRLFVRSKTDWVPTQEGEVYLENARKMLRIKQNTYAVIADMAGIRKQTISVGMTPGRGPDMFTHIYPAFHRKYPQITVEPRELSVKKQQEEIRKGNLDLGFMTLLESQRTVDHYIELFEEEILLGIPEDHPLSACARPVAEAESVCLTGSSDGAAYPEIDLNLFRDEPFVRMYKESTVRAITDQIFKDACFSPHILFETSSIYTVLSMIQANLCVGLIPYHYVRKKPEGVRFFCVPQHPRWTVCACCRKDAYVSSAMKTLIQLAKAYWTE